MAIHKIILNCQNSKLSRKISQLAVRNQCQVTVCDHPPKPIPVGVSLVHILATDDFEQLIAQFSNTKPNCFYALESKNPSEWLDLKLALERFISVGANFRGVKKSGELIKSKADISSNLTALAKELQNVTAYVGFADNILTVADELLMNAWRATKSGSRRGVDLVYGVKKSYFELTVRDHSGSLKKSVINRHLQRCLDPNRKRILQSKTGAGVGVFIVMTMSHQVSIAVRRARMTEITCRFKICKRVLESELAFRAFSFQMV